MVDSDGRERHALRVAVVGSGLAGLTTAYLLCREGCQVWLIEKSERIGFHSASVDVPLDILHEEEKGIEENRDKDKRKDKEVWTVDAPMRSFQGGYYPGLISLYRHLGLPVRKMYYTYSFSRSTRPGSTYFIHSGASGLSLPRLPSRAYTSLSTLIGAILDFISLAICQILLIIISFLSYHRLLPNLTLSDLLVHFSAIPLLGTVWTRFTHDLLLPIFGAVGTMTTSDVLDTPLSPILDYVHSTFGTPHYTLDKGFSARDVASLLVRPVLEQGKGHLLLGEEISSLRFMDKGTSGEIELSLASKGDRDRLCVDRVVLATQASVTRRLAGDLVHSLKGAEKARVQAMVQALGDVEYRETIVVTHRDQSVLPPPFDRQSINLVLPSLPSSSPFNTSPTTTPPPTSPPPQASLTPAQQTRQTSTPDHENENEISDTDSNTTLATPTDRTPLPLKGCPYFPPSPNAIYTMGTHMAVPPREGIEPVLQTTNPIVEIRDGILGISRFERALPLKHAKTTLKSLHPPISSKKRILFLAGSYAHPGIPLLEGCIGSAKRVVCDMLSLEPEGKVGNVNWDIGRGNLIGRAWRWRWRSRSNRIDIE
ncbi:hypothetical protein BCR39DRAFT_512746 [Naematelia encephala]|uniref:Amine oxidase domain-containing protein n=1 Tax=Naematelia encephala TaxID=71784 RepID=A0A1Y2BM85_9TREE|nr:hypothetical protein BCR39DRAFT_512746 [Naematelia encephala]